MKKLFIMFFMFSIVVVLSSSNMKKFIIRIDNPTKEQVLNFSNNGYDIASVRNGEYIDLVVTGDIYNSLKKKGFNPYITQTEEQIKNNLSSRTLDGYRSYEEILSELQTIVANNPDICQLIDIGDTRGKQYSEEGYSTYDDFNHEIWALKISDNVSEEEDEPNILYIGGHHAREPIGVEMVMKIINHLVENYYIDSTIANQINSKQIWCVPLLNPNGHKVVIDETEVFWRKNICDNNEDHQFSHETQSGPDGVDPNRNYSFHWGLVGASDNFYEENYHGSEPFSEPNIQAIRNLVNSHKFVTSISYHSYSELVLYPLGYESGVVAPDNAALSDLAVSMANTIPTHNQAGHYTPSASWELYPCMGTSDDYFYGEEGIFAYTIELGTEFIPQISEANEIISDNIEAAMILLHRTDNRILTGNVVDSYTGEPIEAEIYIDGIDNTGAEINSHRSDQLFGRYYRLLLPGTYSVTFSKFGYLSYTETVTITENSQTILDVQLQPNEVAYTFGGFVRDAITYEPIPNAVIEIKNTPLEPVTTDANGEFTFPIMYDGEYNIKVTADNYNIYFNVDSITQSEQNYPIFLNSIAGESFESGIPTEWNSHIAQNQWELTTSESFEGDFSLYSGSISDNQAASFAIISTEQSPAGKIAFYYKVSSESGYDFLTFYIDNQVQENWSGETGWDFAQFDVSAGSHEYKWVYEKDNYVSNGEDCAYLDLVAFPGENEINEMVVYPNSLNFEMAENTSLDETIVLYNNSDDDVNVSLEINSEYLAFEDGLQNFYLGSYSPKVINFTINSTTQNYSQENVITINYGEDNVINIPISISINNTSNDGDIVPITLNYAYPNPYIVDNTRFPLQFSYYISSPDKINLSIFNVKGQLVKTLVDEKQPKGEHRVIWDTKDFTNRAVTSGIYFYRLQSGKHVEIKKMTIIK